MEPRLILKSLRDFAVRELKEKRAARVHVRRIKAESLLRKGRLPELRVWTVKGAHYLICVFSSDSLRVYYVDKLGKVLGADEFTGAEREKMQVEISKRTKSVFRLPA
jgi:hypothetical protein